MSGFLRRLLNIHADISPVPLMIAAVPPRVMPLMHSGVTMWLIVLRLNTINAGLLSIRPVQIIVAARLKVKMKAERYGSTL